MNPLSPLTYHRRHKKSTLLLVGLIALVTAGIAVMVGMAQPIVNNNARAYIGFLSHLSLAVPIQDHELDPTVVSQIRTHPDIKRAIPENGSGLTINVPSIVVSSSSPMLGIRQDDVQAVLDACNLRLREGRMLRPNTNEFLISAEHARALNLKPGDEIGRGVDEEHYPNILVPMVLVGVLENDPDIAPAARAQVSIASYEYLANHELYRPRNSGLLVISHQGRKEAVDTWLEVTVSSSRTRIETAAQRAARLQHSQQMLQLVLGVVDGLVAIVAALVVGAINQIALTRRMTELGILNAIGYQRNTLIRRLTFETAVIAAIGFFAGLSLAWLILSGIDAILYEPQGVVIDTWALAPFVFAVPIPCTVVLSAWIGAVKLFQRLDAVTIMDRDSASTEACHRRSVTSSSQPLSSHTFYLRHGRRSFVLVVTMAAMIVGVALPVFVFMPMLEAPTRFYLNYLRHVAQIEADGSLNVAPGVIRQIGAYSAVARIVRVQPIEMAIRIPPVATNQVPLYGCYENDIPALMNLFGLSLQEGRLPRERSNEIVLSSSLALNRDIKIGDIVGRPVYELDIIPTELVVVGILSPGDVSLGFASLEYLENHEQYASRPTRLFVIPVEGRKTELDTWLKENVSSSRTTVRTYAEARSEYTQARRGFLLLLAAIECIIAVVAALALAALNHVFFAQRRDELGILHAIGRSRSWLVLRTTLETSIVVVTAWLAGAAICLISLICAQASIFAPSGVPLNLRDGAPWLFTLPIPLAVTAASAGLVARTLACLDPIAIVERRT